MVQFEKLVHAGLCGALLCLSVSADEHNHKYEDSEEVVFWVNTVGPYNNRQETYPYFQLPYCTGKKDTISHHHETMGEILLGMDLDNMGIDAKFKEDQTDAELCSTELYSDDIKLFRYAVSHMYWYQIYVDDLPVWGFVGPITNPDDDKKPQYSLYTHRDFYVTYNENQIISVNVTSGKPVLLEIPEDRYPVKATFTYSIKWLPTKVAYADRFDRYLDHDFFEHKIHWFSILNSFIMVLILLGFVAVLLLRALKKDFNRYDKEYSLRDIDRDLGDEYGWKQVNADVFRAPKHLLIMSAFIGTGAQLIFLSFFMIAIVFCFDLYTNRGTILNFAILFYALTAIISGAFSSSFYSKYGGKNWIKTFIVTASLWPGIISSVTLYNNIIALFYASSRAINFYTLVTILFIQILIVYPANLVGTILGRNIAGQGNFPCRVNPIPRHVPEKPWFSEPPLFIALGGILPFGSIFIEMYFIFTSFWAYKIYYVYGFMLGVFLILLTVTACVTIVITYLLLNSEEHRWHWTSFLSGGSAAAYIFLYAFYYFHAKTK